MKELFAEIRGALLGTLVLAVACCVLYPLVVFGIGQTLFRNQANGSLIVDTAGQVRGSKLLAQRFTGERYFHPRPSAAGAHGYDAANSSGSNLGPTSQKLKDAIKDRITAYRTENGLAETDSVPADAVTASGSGLDPHISVRNAQVQAPRVARARNLPTERVLQLVSANTDDADFGALGDEGVNVLRLNLALDQAGGE